MVIEVGQHAKAGALSQPVRRRVAAWTAYLIAVVFLTAAVMKSIRPVPTTRSIEHLTGLPESRAYLLVCALVGVEVFLGIMLFVSRRRRAAAAISAVVLVVFSAALVMLVSDPWAPECSCLPLLKVAASARAENAVGLGRNTLLLVGCAIILLWTPRKSATA